MCSPRDTPTLPPFPMVLMDPIEKVRQVQEARRDLNLREFIYILWDGVEIKDSDF